MTSHLADWPPLARFVERERRLGEWMRRRGRLAAVAYEFVRFGVKQAWACLFGGTLLVLIVASRLWYPAEAPIHRYDALVFACVALQAILLLTRLETLAEAQVIFVFHVVGTVMELFKTSVGSWAYPETSLLRLGGVPLFTGFMYAAVGSYIARAWRLFDFRFVDHPRLPALLALSAAIYANFFADHWGFDARWFLVAAAAILFRRTVIVFDVWGTPRRMPLLTGFLLVALFIWFGENLGTAGGAWLYPSQRHGWAPVPPSKLASWFLLMLVSYTLVAMVEGPQRVARPAERVPAR